MSEGRATPINTDLKSFLVSFLAADALAYAAYWFWTKDDAGLGVVPEVVAGLLVAAAAFFVYRAFQTTGVAQCPGCGRQVDGLSRTSNLGAFCRCCGRYVERSHGELILSPEDRVARAPVFRTELPSEIRWPPGCCVCGSEATREIAATVRSEREVTSAAAVGQDLAVRVASLGTMKRVEKQVTTQTVQVPHCAEHDDGACLLTTDAYDEAAIGFRWHGYARSFCDLNDTIPVNRV